MNIKGSFSYMRYIFELGFRAHRKVVRPRYPASKLVYFSTLATITDADSEPTAIKVTSRLLAKCPVIYRQLRSARGSIFFRALRGGRDRVCHRPSKFVCSRLAATVADTFRRPTPAIASFRLLSALTVSVCQFSPFFASIVLQLVRLFSGGIRLLAMQETGGQLLAKKEGSRAPLLATFGGGCA